ncbi:MAG: acetyl esterase/lipase, partial [Limisphaerales bacterium]
MIRLLSALAFFITSISMSAATPVKSTQVYKVVDGLEIKADVFSYPDSKVRPVVVWFHGGALINGGRGGVSGVVRKFAADNGYVLVSFDYRLAPESK